MCLCVCVSEQLCVRLFVQCNWKLLECGSNNSSNNLLWRVANWSSSSSASRGGSSSNSSSSTGYDNNSIRHAKYAYLISRMVNESMPQQQQQQKFVHKVVIEFQLCLLQLHVCLCVYVCVCFAFTATAINPHSRISHPTRLDQCPGTDALEEFYAHTRTRCTSVCQQLLLLLMLLLQLQLQLYLLN